MLNAVATFTVATVGTPWKRRTVVNTGDNYEVPSGLAMGS